MEPVTVSIPDWKRMCEEYVDPKGKRYACGNPDCPTHGISASNAAESKRFERTEGWGLEMEE